MAITVLIDTDIGDDIDDALALALALRSPELDVVGVTTVFQCAPLRARLVARLLAAYGRPGVPVIAGTDRPLLGSVRRDWAPNQAGVLDAEPDRPPSPGRAVDFIIAEGMRRPGLVLLPIGPLTNVALAFAVEPRLAARVRVVAMGGAWDRPEAEYNIRCDPEALALLLAAGARVDFVGLDVTTRVRLRPADLRHLAAAPPEGPRGTLLRFLRAWQRGGGLEESACPLLHDPLAVAAAFRPDLLTWAEGAVSVELGADAGAGYGRTRLDAAKGGAGQRVARGVDVEGFADLFGQRVCQPD